MCEHVVKNIGVDDGKASFSLAPKLINGGCRRSPELPNISNHGTVSKHYKAYK